MKNRKSVDSIVPREMLRDRFFKLYHSFTYQEMNDPIIGPTIEVAMKNILIEIRKGINL